MFRGPPGLGSPILPEDPRPQLTGVPFSMVLLSLRDGHARGIGPWDGPRTLWGPEPRVSMVLASISLCSLLQLPLPGTTAPEQPDPNEPVFPDVQVRILSGTPPSCPPQSLPPAVTGDTPGAAALFRALRCLVWEVGHEGRVLWFGRDQKQDLQFASPSV